MDALQPLPSCFLSGKSLEIASASRCVSGFARLHKRSRAGKTIHPIGI
jgi:hypothetical protein